MSMVAIGNFFFRYRNGIFVLFYAGFFLPGPALFEQGRFGPHYLWWPVLLGLAITVGGQLVRGATIGLAYIIRGGRGGKPYAEGLVTEGIFNHCRNPLYVGNILMLLGLGVLSNSLYYVALMIPAFVFIYQAIVLAEEDFLRGKFGPGYDEYCRQVNRWLPRLEGLGRTFAGMEFNWKRWLLKEHTTQYVWLAGIYALLLVKYPQFTGGDEALRNGLLAAGLAGLTALYGLVRYLKKSGRLTE